ncbi:hypothetical protein TELCIR_07984 [Teladorsagia circumcincta]|uniref:Uncharacterized protein n=1 Tax=Teladorsagia circumcincta TaxID=45464 RepID=A0A2G9UKA9_TELCI|nr:hypothetical protein TELCIR_07984 [Teladorsagia circumcincta]
MAFCLTAECGCIPLQKPRNYASSTTYGDMGDKLFKESYELEKKEPCQVEKSNRALTEDEATPAFRGGVMTTSSAIWMSINGLMGRVDVVHKATFGVRQKNGSEAEYINKTFCLVHWPSTPAAQWYITTCSVIIFILPVLVIFYCYYQVFCKLREAAKSNSRCGSATTIGYKEHVLLQ